MQKSYKMGILYKDEKDIKISVEIKQKDGVIQFDFTSNCGKFGTDEGLAEYELTVNQLLKILATTFADTGFEHQKIYDRIDLVENWANDVSKSVEPVREVTVCPVCKKTFEKGWGEFCSQDCWDTDM